MLLYYITDRTQFPGDETTRRRLLLEKIAEAARCSVDYIQLRERDLPTRELEALANQAVRVIRKHLRTENREPRAALLVNSRTDVAIAAGADGVHLRSDDISTRQAREILSAHTRNSKLETRNWLVGVSCHSAAEVARAAAEDADFAVFAPVFEKKDAPKVRPAGLEALHEACQGGIPVLALGGVTLENARDCVGAGAAGIAAIRLFQEHDIAQIVRRLRS
ncbi:MAG: thiamine phosphate synthase [Acidobacteriia bacterium]|nr:thiamine phosphate synthase [Terriglobia bacterium]